jgi:hypothetical protein
MISAAIFATQLEVQGFQVKQPYFAAEVLSIRVATFKILGAA